MWPCGLLPLLPASCTAARTSQSMAPPRHSLVATPERSSIGPPQPPEAWPLHSQPGTTQPKEHYEEDLEAESNDRPGRRRRPYVLDGCGLGDVGSTLLLDKREHQQQRRARRLLG